ncbi:carbohydrate ABC transporter substrate-binding protein (CUT1 family) [Promicromonospora sp. AC04]|uniref:ABC transporter substrate-binding protein n=1 Tax=Promicromonospora sp. AC04 TaxID=2135723 RepID=UPI000D343134|nr:extracellular solute-binding protein [Promicromonospora sp. AC04]PUB20814.1 carbohydrate ABC transporter substrate-binding protein (CUT1 family) [Promicromonospora sp. AC04]
MTKRHILGATSAAAVAALVLGACSGGSDDGGGEGDGPSGTITVLTNRTDIVDTVLEDYVAEFQKTYPAVDVEFEALTDYEGDVTVRLNSGDYGDVLLIPNAVDPDQLATFFEPLGSVDELGEKYRFIHQRAFEGDAYGIATFGTAMGYVLNKPVWEKAGITEPPATPEEFLDALSAIKETSPEAIPYYTNYADGWPLSSWQSNQGTIDGPEGVNLRTEQNAPWTEGMEQYAIDSLLFDIVEAGLSEPDPTTTNWEESKNLIGTGQVGTMVLGSWSVTQLQDAAEAAGKPREDIGFWPMPWQTDGKFHSTVGGDYSIGISKNSENKEAAEAWLYWFLDESGFADSQGGLAPQVDGQSPATLQDFEEFGVEEVELAPAPEGEESLLSDIYTAAEIDLSGDQYRRAFVDVARGAADGDKASAFADLNDRWATARAEVVG